MKDFLKRHKYPLGILALLLAYVSITNGLVALVDLYFTGKCGYTPLTLGAFIVHFFLARMSIPFFLSGARSAHMHGTYGQLQLPIMITTALLVGLVAWIRTKRKTSALLWCFVAYVAATVVTNDIPFFPIFLLFFLHI